jgi:hypothetical protein
MASVIDIICHVLSRTMNTLSDEAVRALACLRDLDKLEGLEYDDHLGGNYGPRWYRPAVLLGEIRRLAHGESQRRSIVIEQTPCSMTFSEVKAVLDSWSKENESHRS